MASIFSGQIDLQVRASRTVPGSLSIPAEILSLAEAIPLDNGSGVYEALRFFSLHDHLEPMVAEDIFLTGIEDALGDALSFSTIRALIIKNHATDPAAIVTVSGPIFSVIGADYSDAIKIRAGGCLVLLAPRDGYAITAEVTDQISLASGSEEIEFDLILIGT